MSKNAYKAATQDDFWEIEQNEIECFLSMSETEVFFQGQMSDVYQELDWKALDQMTPVERRDEVTAESHRIFLKHQIVLIRSSYHFHS